MGYLTELLTVLNNLSPIGLAAMLGLIIYMLVRGQRDTAKQVQSVGDNHLHELPILVENSHKTVEILQRIEVRLAENFSVIRERLDGK